MQRQEQRGGSLRIIRHRCFLLVACCGFIICVSFRNETGFIRHYDYNQRSSSPRSSFPINLHGDDGAASKMMAENSTALVNKNYSAQHTSSSTSVVAKDQNDRMAGQAPGTPKDQDDKTANELIPITNVLLMGQFNFGDIAFESVRDWVNIWSRYFAQIIVAGPFTVETQTKLEKAGIQFKIGMNDSGYVSPYKNLLDTMLDYKNLSTAHQSSSVSHVGGAGAGAGAGAGQHLAEAVLYLHDDALLNITRLYNGRKSLPMDSIIQTGMTVPQPLLYSIHVEREQRRWPNGTEFSEVVLPISRFELIPADTTRNRTIYHSVEGLLGVLRGWTKWEMCLRHQVAMLSKYDDWWEDFSDYYSISTTMTSSSNQEESSVQSSDGKKNETVLNLDGKNETALLLSRITYRFSFPHFLQADFLYVPLRYTDIFERAARPHVQSNVHLECAVPTILGWIMQKGGGADSTIVSNNKSQDAPLPPPADDSLPLVPSLEGIPMCTSWDYWNVRGKVKMLEQCVLKKSVLGMVHPVKIGKVTSERYSYWLDSIQSPPRPSMFSLPPRGPPADRQSS